MVIVKPQLAPVNSGKLPSMTLDEIAQAAKPRNQVADAKSVIRWLRANANTLGVAPQRIVATPTSGGGDLALQSYLNKAFEDPHDDRSVSHQPNALVLFCPAFDGIDICFVEMKTLLKEMKANAPSFVPLLSEFINDTSAQYATPRDHRADFIRLAAKRGMEEGIDESEVKRFQQILSMFNQRDWQLLHPAEDALKMSASRILTKAPLPPTLLMYGTRDHLYKHQQAFVERARSLGQEFKLKIYDGGGHSFMLQAAFMQPSTDEVENFLRSIKFIDHEA
jgi:acetyl esterase/lipase